MWHKNLRGILYILPYSQIKIEQHCTVKQVARLQNNQSEFKTPCPGGVLKINFLVEMCRWENEKWPIHLPNLDRYIYQKTKICPNFEKLLLNLPKCWRFFQKFRENRLLKKNVWPIDLPKLRFEKGSFIYQRGENGTLFRGTGEFKTPCLMMLAWP